MKALTLALCILALLGSAASGYFWWSIGNTKEQLRQDLSSATTRADGLQTNLTETEGKLEDTNKRLEAESAELGDTKRKLTAAEARNVQIAREVDTLKKSVAEKEQTEKELNTQLDTLRKDLVQARLAAQVGNPEESERYKQTIAGLESRLAELTGAAPVSADGTPAAPAKPARSERTAAARVASVGTQNAFVILELGTEDGIVSGDRFAITRGGETIAESVISEVKESFAIAQIAPSSIKTTLKAGDVATFKQ